MNQMEYEYVEYSRKLKELLQHIFNDAFMCENTRFSSFEAFQYSSAVFVNWHSDMLIYRKDILDNFVKESTDYQSWNDMVITATDACFHQGE